MVAVNTDLEFVGGHGQGGSGCGCGCNGKPVIYRSVWDRLCLQLFGAMPPGMDPASQLEDINIWTDHITLVSDANPYSFTVETDCIPAPEAQDFILYKDTYYVIGAVSRTDTTHYSCTNCQPIDESIIASYIALVNTNEYASSAEQERDRNETERIANERDRVSAEQDRVSQAASDHGIATSDHTTAAGDHTTATTDHGTAAGDHLTAVLDHTQADSDHERASEDHRIAKADHDYIEGLDFSSFVTKTTDDLVNYYLKSETYTQAQVNSLISAIQGFSYEVVSELPTASASTMGKIYLVPSADPQTQNVKDEYITIDNGSSANPRYTWEQIGSTAVNLSGYVTTQDLNTALADYTTTADLTTLLAGKQPLIDSSHKLDYSLLSNTPTLGTAAAKNVPSSGNAGTSEVVMGDDTRLSDSRPASDVSSWAKAANKPTYDYSEIQNTPSIPSAPGTLDTTQTTAQSTSSNEALSGNVKLHKVSKTGDYGDLLNKPTIPAAQVNSDWNASSGVAQILNKPSIPTVESMTNTEIDNAVNTAWV